ncbi:MAG: TfpX/TfpZ family type IV pilin accessory protein [Burkholderiales bacterium]
MTVVAQRDDGAPPRATPARSTLMERVRAAAIHLLLSVAVGAGVLALVLFVWYPDPLMRLLGVDAILLIMLGVDVVLGPLFTLIVFDRRKRSLKWDLAVIAALQVAALLYGLHTVYQGRPAFVAYVKDRFEVVSPAELLPEARAAARSNSAARIDPLAPRFVSARLPESAEERQKILVEALTQGRDVQHHPRLYVEYDTDAASALERALPLGRLRALNPGAGAAIDAAVAATGLPEASLRYLPVRGPARDGAALLDAASGRVVKLVALVPW